MVLISGKKKKDFGGRQSFGDNNRVALCVENPQDPSVDIGRSAFAIKKVQRAF